MHNIPENADLISQWKPEFMHCKWC